MSLWNLQDSAGAAMACHGLETIRWNLSHISTRYEPVPQISRKLVSWNARQPGEFDQYSSADRYSSETVAASQCRIFHTP
ncbi:hypothetical protein PCANC_01137 [Puccinia coronata f. sp. avenae]|uniref:Uncharacterized protein n=1 Tax=Puccinia coronata f. sp. avenae TaxID=200324 RepID=A0A2N5W5U5_9BASI|nr:hypothetical protein PCANC_01137 [Puccinia coronata f. sp. avenae]